MENEGRNIFSSEAELLDALAHHARLLLDCAGGKITFGDFLKRYNNFYFHYALDGHESDERERALLEKHGVRIRPHKEMAYEVLAKLCADEDAAKRSYFEAGRIGSNEGLRRIKLLVEEYFKVGD